MQSQKSIKQNIKQVKIGSSTNIQLSQKTFMKYYEQNIKLKKQLQQQNKTIKQLRQKLQRQLNMNKTFISPKQQLTQLKEQLKKTNYRGNSTSKKGNTTFYGTGSTQSKKVQNLLQIIQHYKQKLLIAEQQSANLRQKNTLLLQDLNLKDKRSNNIQSYQQKRQNNTKLQRQKQQQLTQRLKSLIHQCELQKQRNRYYQAQMKRLQVKIKTLQSNQQQLHDLKVQTRRLQQKIRNLTMLNKSNDTYDIKNIQDRNKQLQMKLKVGIEKYDKIKDQQIKSNAQKKLLTQQLIIKTSQSQQLQKQLNQLKKNNINSPIIKKLLENQHLLAKVIGQIQSQKVTHTNNFNSTSSYMKSQASYQKILLQKQQLAKQLIDMQNKIKIMQQNWRQKQTILKIQKQQISHKLNNMPLMTNNNNKKNYTSKSGVPYDGDISMFTDQIMSIASGVNYFDLFLGQINLLENMIKTVANINNVSNLMILATVDFYNFNTVKSKLIQGIQSNLHSQFTFKILEDDFFFKYLNKQSFKVDFWASQGNKHTHIGQIQIPLKPLYLNSKDKIGPVINTSAAIFLKQKTMGTIQYDMRMRLPIHEHVSKILNINNIIPSQQQKLAPLRKLIIKIQSGSGFKQGSNLFVYYTFRMQDYYTSTSKGPSPVWSHSKIHDLRYNQDVKNYIRKNQIQFTIFDDNVVLYDDKDTDVIGSGVIPLVGLLQDKSIKQRVQIRKNGIKIGMIDVTMFWYENKQKVSNNIKNQQDYLNQIHKDIRQYIKQKNTSLGMQFRLIDENKTGWISWSQFYNWFSVKVKKNHSHNYSLNLIKKYYQLYYTQRLQQINLLVWETKLEQENIIQKKKDTDINNNNNEMNLKWGLIKQLINKNSKQLNNQISLEDYLEKKDLFNMSLQIDKNGNGKISKTQIIKYMNQHNINMPIEEIQDQINIVDFLKKIQKSVRKI